MVESRLPRVNPTSVRSRLRSVRTNSAAPASIVTPTASCTTSRRACARRCAGVTRADAEVSVAAPPRASTNAGTVPASSAATAVEAKANSRARRSMPTSSSRGTLEGASAISTRTPHAATMQPAAPPMAVRIALSTSNWLTRRPRAAPSAVRTRISWTRDEASPTRNPATLAHAMTRSSSAPPSSTNSGVRTGATSRSASDVTDAPVRVLKRKFARSRTSISMVASAIVAPSRSRP